MKTLPVMFEIPGLFSKLLILHVGFWSILGEESCTVQLRVLRHSEHATVGQSFKMKCPVTYCAQRPNVTWCKYSGKDCLPLELGPRQHTDWEDEDQVPAFTLRFEPVYLSDDGWYGCSIDFTSYVINSNITVLHVTERTQNYSEHHLITSSCTNGCQTSQNDSLPEAEVTGVSITLHSLLIFLYVKLSLLVIVLLILGFVFFQKRNYFRK